MISGQTARLRLSEYLYCACPGRECYLPEILSMTIVYHEIAAIRAESVCKAHWTAWSVHEHTETGKYNEVRTVYIDSNEIWHDQPGYEYVRTRGWNYTTKWRPYRKVKMNHTMNGRRIVEDGRNHTEGEQVARRTILHTEWDGEKTDAWIRTLPVIELPPESSPLFTPYELTALAELTQQDADALCRKAVPGERYIDLRITYTNEQTTRRCIIPVYQGRFCINGQEFTAYISAMDATLHSLPALPETAEQARQNAARAASDAKIREINARWDARVARLREECAANCMQLQRTGEQLQQENEAENSSLEAMETAHLGRIFLCIAGVILFVCLFFISLRHQGMFSWFLVTLGSLLGAAGLAFCLWQQIRHERSISDAVQAERTQLRSKHHARLSEIREQIAEQQLRLSNALTQVQADREQELWASVGAHLALSVPGRANPAVLACLRDETLTEPERMERLLRLLPSTTELPH